MGKLETVDIILGVLYATGAIALLVASYRLYLKRFKRSKLEAINDVTLSTSRYDQYQTKTQFLVELNVEANVRLMLLDKDENETAVLLDKNLAAGDHLVDFDPLNYQNGDYYLSLKTENVSILRKIRIIHE